MTDSFSRRIVGWRTAGSMPTELPLDALEMALWTRQCAGEAVEGLVHHSDAVLSDGPWCATRRWCAVRRWESREVQDLLTGPSQRSDRS